jgi:hypothetical protein
MNVRNDETPQMLKGCVIVSADFNVLGLGSFIVSQGVKRAKALELG